MELYKKYRPKTFKRLAGQPETVSALMGMLKKGFPHSILLSGPSGCGKTTIARILRGKLRCGEHDFSEMNCADFRGIDMVRDIRGTMNLAPMGGECRIWLIDEAHQLSSQAQNAFLKILEDTPKHVYFMLATTIPEKLLKTIRTRCTDVTVKSVPADAMAEHLGAVLKAEKKTVDSDVIDKIVECAEGSARKALVLLDTVLGMENVKEQMEVVAKASAQTAGIEIARALMKGERWPAVAKILKECNEDPESLRWMILGYFRTVLLGGGKYSARAAQIMSFFENNFYDTKAAGLALCCYLAVTAD